MLARAPLTVVLWSTLFTTASLAQEKPARPAELKALDPYTGTWTTAVITRPSISAPDGSKFTSKESIAWALKDRFVLSRGSSQPDGVKTFWVMGYDPKTRSYPFWFFNSTGVAGGEWSLTWDEATRTFTGKATDTPKGWTSGMKTHFVDKTTTDSSAWMKNEAGKFLFDADYKKTRQPDDGGARLLAAWSKTEKPAAPLPPELKPLERLVGNWDVTSVFKVAEWTPKELKLTSKVNRVWVLDGRFLLDTAEISDGAQSFSLTTYDPQRKAYRGWYFNSEGHASKSMGTWDEAKESFTYTSALDDGLTSTASARFMGKDRHIWTVIIKDGKGKVFFDAEWDVKRRKE